MRPVCPDALSSSRRCCSHTRRPSSDEHSEILCRRCSSYSPGIFWRGLGPKPADRSFPGTRRAQAEGLRSEPCYLRKNPCPGSRDLRLREPKSGGGTKKEMAFASKRHHEFWTADVRYLDMLDEELLADGMVYAITILENYSRAVLASSVTRRQDLNAFLAVLYRAIQHYGPPEAFVTDSGSIFLANRAQAIYRLLGIRKVEIEKGQPWQSYLQTAWGVQEHYAHQHRKKGKRSPSEVLSWVRTPRYAPLPGGGP